MGAKAKRKKLISLKEAAKITGYSSDYIGHLIRSGKIMGEQVYVNVAWMTSADEVLAYKNKVRQENNCGRKQKGNKEHILEQQFNLIRIFCRAAKSSLPLLIVIIFIFIILSFYLFYIFFHNVELSGGLSKTGKESALFY